MNHIDKRRRLRRRLFPWVVTGPLCGVICTFVPGWAGSVLVLAAIATGVAIHQQLIRRAS